MNLYHTWCSLKEGVQDTEFADRVHAYLGHLKKDGAIAGYRLTRRKLGLSPPGLGDFHIIIEVEGLAQLDKAFEQVASRTDPAEGLHQKVNSLVKDVSFALYRDFPDAVRVRGEEKI